MTFDDAQSLMNHGAYSELLRGAVAEQIRAREAGEDENEVLWTIWVVKACRYIGRSKEGKAHSLHALEVARSLGDPTLIADALYSHALMLKVSGKQDEAIRILEEATEYLPEEGAENQRAVYLLEKAELLMEKEEWSGFESMLTKAGAAVNWLGEPRLLAWVLYLYSIRQTALQATMNLMAAMEITRDMNCPELEWQILWRLAQKAAEDERPDMERDFAWRALSILCSLAEPLWSQDLPAFWKLGARAAFVDYGEKRFGPSFREKMVLGRMAPGNDITQWEEMMAVDTKLLPSFVRDKLEGGTRKRPKDS